MSDFERDGFFDSDLSELSDDEEDNVPSSSRTPARGGTAPSTRKDKSKGSTSTTSKHYVVKDVLRAPRPVQYTVKSLYGARKLHSFVAG